MRWSCASQLIWKWESGGGVRWGVSLRGCRYVPIPSSERVNFPTPEPALHISASIRGAFSASSLATLSTFFRSARSHSIHSTLLVSRFSSSNCFLANSQCSEFADSKNTRVARCRSRCVVIPKPIPVVPPVRTKIFPVRVGISATLQLASNMTRGDNVVLVNGLCTELR